MNTRRPQQKQRQGTGKPALYTLEKAATQADAVASQESWGRLPKCGGKLQGLSRSKLNQLILPSAANGFRPPVKSISVRNPGTIRGIRLIFIPSLYSYLESLAREQDAQLEAGE